MAFVNSFLSYLMLLLVIVVVAGCGFAAGRFLRKLKGNKTDVKENTIE